ncbi:hypothetical protein [Paracoccus siganidrum]|uniref:hypothetical protein n=1 Tax=Paracoccus siganidrum TaxID=1276757 RepID=UPI000E7715DF|nr:hypothetical protein [Paracoccus siganidrum]RMC30082.1 hypothetical protein C9E82_18890 [Paracoccus siganidrum]
MSTKQHSLIYKSDDATWLQLCQKIAAESTGKLDEGTRAMQALMGLTASGSFGPNGAQIDINGKGARRLAKAEHGQDE